MNGRQKTGEKIVGSQPQAGSIDAGMTADKFIFQHIGINQQPYMPVCIIGKSQNAHRAWSNIEKTLHVFGIGKGKPG